MLTSINVQTRLWYISAAVASVKFLLCCSCSGATFGLFFPCPIEDIFAYKDSLRGRRMKGKGKGVLSARETREAREEGRRKTSAR